MKQQRINVPPYPNTKKSTKGYLQFKAILSESNNMQMRIPLAIKQAFLIAYLTGFLWLRRNPMSMVFTAVSPFSLLFVLFVVSNGHYIQFAVAGNLVMALVGYGLALGQDISFYKTEYKVQDVFVASPVSSLTYMSGLALSELLFGLPALAVPISLALFFRDFDSQLAPTIM